MRAILAALAVATVAGAQAPAPGANRTGAVAGTVRDTLGHPIRLVAILVEGTDLSAITDDSGRFHLARIPAGKNEFTIRRIGFSSVEFGTTLAPDTTLVLDIRMRALQALNTVTVLAERSAHLEKAGFFERKQMGLGSFVTPERIDSLNYLTTPAQLLRGVRGLDISCRGRCAVHTRSPPDCLNLFVNGARIEGQLDDNVDLSEVYAIEVYERPVLVPSEFQGKLPMKQGRDLTLKAGCGALVVWTRGRTGR